MTGYDHTEPWWLPLRRPWRLRLLGWLCRRSRHETETNVRTITFSFEVDNSAYVDAMGKARFQAYAAGQAFDDQWRRMQAIARHRPGAAKSACSTAAHDGGPFHG